MYNIALLIILCAAAECANYQRYGEPNGGQYSTYSSYSTVSNPYSQYPYKTGGGYGSDMANYPDGSRYPNYSPGYSTNKYDPYTTQRSNVFYPPGGYSTQRYANNYNQGYDQGYGGYGKGYGSSYGTGYNTGYGTGYGSGYSSNTYSSYEMPFMNNMGEYCVNRSPQNSIWVDSLMGMWYGVEFIQHLAGDSRVDYTQTCIVIHVSEPVDQPSTENDMYHVQYINAKFRKEYRHLRLLWDEAGQTIEYSLYFKNDSAGYWQVFEGQNGTLPNMYRYKQFSGTIQVLKAVNDHMLLNFCQEGVNGRSAQLFSVLFSRDPGYMERWELDSVHSMLQNKKLSIASRRMVCGNSADRPLAGLASSLILLLLAYVLSSV